MSVLIIHKDTIMWLFHKHSTFMTTQNSSPDFNQRGLLLPNTDRTIHPGLPSAGTFYKCTTTLKLQLVTFANKLTFAVA